VPATHSVQLPAPAAELQLPAAQEAHRGAPAVANLPAGHVAHVAADAAPSAAEAVPAGHCAQPLEPVPDA